MPLKSKVIFSHIIRIIVGLVFILSAVFKLLSIDVFELYVFSFQIFDFDLSSVLSRLMIGIEMTIGILLITNIHFKKTWRISILLLILFSAFLIFQIIRGNNENCHCFGDLLKLSPLESLIKNSVLLGLLLLIKNEVVFQFKYFSYIFLFATTFSITLPFVLSPPDFLVDYSREGMDLKKVVPLINGNESLKSLHCQEGKKMICMFSVTCPFCELAAKKISVMAEKYGLENNIIYVFTGDKNNLNEFWIKSDSQKFNYVFLPTKNFFTIAGPTVPRIYLSDNGEIIMQYNYRSLNEKEIKDFFEEE